MIDEFVSRFASIIKIRSKVFFYQSSSHWWFYDFCVTKVSYELLISVYKGVGVWCCGIVFKILAASLMTMKPSLKYTLGSINNHTNTKILVEIIWKRVSLRFTLSRKRSQSEIVKSDSNQKPKMKQNMHHTLLKR